MMIGTCDECKNEDVKIYKQVVTMTGRPTMHLEICKKCAAAYEDYINRGIAKRRGK